MLAGESQTTVDPTTHLEEAEETEEAEEVSNDEEATSKTPTTKGPWDSLLTTEQEQELPRTQATHPSSETSSRRRRAVEAPWSM